MSTIIKSFNRTLCKDNLNVTKLIEDKIQNISELFFNYHNLTELYLQQKYSKGEEIKSIDQYLFLLRRVQ